MLKTRVIPVTLCRGYQAVKSIGFSDYRNYGSPVVDVKQYSRQGVDEYIFLDIDATPEGRSPDFELMEDVVNESLMPLTVGGGVRSVADVRRLLRIGADKIVICSAAFDNPALITDSAAIFGSQCIVGCIDVKRSISGKPEVYSASGAQARKRNAVEWAIELRRLGVGELLVNSIDHDGSMKGYDVDLIRSIADHVNVPVVALGGAGDISHFAEVLNEGHASAVAAASIFYYTGISPVGARESLKEMGFPVR